MHTWFNVIEQSMEDGLLYFFVGFLHPLTPLNRGTSFLIIVALTLPLHRKHWHKY